MHRPPVMSGPDQGDTQVAERPGGGRSRFNLRTFEALKVRDYRFYLGSSLAQMACMNMQMMASGWFMYKLSDSAALLGLTMLANAFPTLLLSPLGGIIADRVSKKAVLIVGFLASALMVLTIALAVTLNLITWQWLVVSSFVQGTIMAFMMPSRQSIISELVGREHLTNAIALNMAGMNVNRLGAPAIAGFVIAFVGIEGVYYLMTGLYLVGVVLILPVRRRAVAVDDGQPRRTMVTDLLEGVAYVRNNRTVGAILVLSLLGVVLSMPYAFLLPVFTEDVLSVGPEKLGLLISASGLGALVGSFIIASMGNGKRGMVYLHALTATGIALIAFAISNSYTISLGILVLVGMAQAVRMTLSTTLLQSYTEDAYMGRVMSLFMMEWGVTSLGSFGVSVAAEVVGVQLAVGVTAAALVGVGLYYYAFSPRIRRLD